MTPSRPPPAQMHDESAESRGFRKTLTSHSAPLNMLTVSSAAAFSSWRCQTNLCGIRQACPSGVRGVLTSDSRRTRPAFRTVAILPVGDGRPGPPGPSAATQPELASLISLIPTGPGRGRSIRRMTTASSGGAR